MTNQGKLAGPLTQQSALRIIDANLNRASEGLRVVEDYCRFVLADWHLTGRCKRLRDRLALAVSPLAREALATARDTPGDVGATTPFTAEIRPECSRLSLDQIAIANAERVKQALRAIEEYAKLLDAGVAGQVEAIRYEWYTLEKACVITSTSRKRLEAVKLYVLIDGGSSERDFADRVQVLVRSGVHAMQLRDKRLDDRSLLERARLLRRVIDDPRAEQTVNTGMLHFDSPAPTGTVGPLFIMNDRPDLAALARADGVHVGQEEIAVADVRQFVGPEMLVGVSTHTIEQARQAVLEGANYIGCGPTFPSETKQFDRFPGLEFLRQVAAEISLPAFAIGGITRENLSQVLSTDFTRVAVGGAITTLADVETEVRLFLSALLPQ